MIVKNIISASLAASIASLSVLAEAPLAVTHQRPENAIPALRGMPYHTVAENGFNSTSLARAMDFTPVADGSIFDKRQREEDPDTGALLCKNAPCPDDR